MSNPQSHFSCSIDEDQAALRFVSSNPGSALCTIVGIEGSYSRRLGAQLAICPEGSVTGSLADGCLEQELVTHALAGQDIGPQIIRFGKGSPFIDFRLPCGSGIDILIDPCPDARAVANTLGLLDRRQQASLPLPSTRPGLLTERNFTPSLRLVICGTGSESERLVELARACGVSSILAGPDTGMRMDRMPSHIPVDPWTAIVILFHDHDWEGAVLDWALGSQAFYIGAIGGKQTRERRRMMLAEKGHAPEMASRIRSPVGSIPRARDPGVLAISILSEIVGVYETVRT